MKLYLLLILPIFTIGCRCTGYVDHTIEVVNYKGDPIPFAAIFQEHSTFNENHGPAIPPKVVLADEKGAYTFKKIPCRISSLIQYSALSQDCSEHYSPGYSFSNSSKNGKLTVKTESFPIKDYSFLREFNITKNTDIETKKKLLEVKKNLYNTILKNNPKANDDNELDERYNLWTNHPIRIKSGVWYYTEFQPYRYDED